MHRSAILDQIPLDNLSKTQMDIIIEQVVGGKRETDCYVGLRFLQLLNQSNGPRAVIRFIKVMNVAVDEGRIIESDMEEFGRKEQALLNDAAWATIPRRDFLGTLAWTLAGIGTLVGGLAIEANYVHTLIQGGLFFQPGTASFERVQDIVLHWCMVPLDTFVLSPALIQEGVRHWRETKLEHITNAVAFMARELGIRPSPE